MLMETAGRPPHLWLQAASHLILTHNPILPGSLRAIRIQILMSLGISKGIGGNLQGEEGLCHQVPTKSPPTLLCRNFHQDHLSN